MIAISVAIVAGAFALDASPDLLGIVAGLVASLASLAMLASAARGG